MKDFQQRESRIAMRGCLIGFMIGSIVTALAFVIFIKYFEDFGIF